MRTIESIQRYGEDLPNTALSFNVETGLLAAAGTVEDIEMERARQEVLEAMANDPITEAEVKDTVGGDTRWTQKAIRSLVADVLLVRTGAGKKGDPYRYTKAHFLISANRDNEQNENTENPDRVVL